MSGARRWSKFWWEDYEGDPLLSSCSLASQGLWMRMLCLMHRGEPYGHLLINGKQPSVRVLSSILRTNEREFARLIAELEEYGVFSRTDDGTIYSRRMVKDAERSEEGREAIAKRWGNGGGGQEPNTPPNRVPNGEAKRDLVGDLLHQEARSKKQEARSRKEESFPSERCPTKPAYTSDFEEWWAAYPERFPSDSKARAAKAYAKALKSVSAGFLLEQLRSYSFSDKPQFRKMAATWLNECSWEDRRPEPKPTLKSRMAWMFNEDGSIRPPEDFIN